MADVPTTPNPPMPTTAPGTATPTSPNSTLSLSRLGAVPGLSTEERPRIDANTVGHGALGLLLGLRDTSPWTVFALLVAWEVASDEIRNIAVGLISPAPPARREHVLNSVIDVSFGMLGWYAARLATQHDAHIPLTSAGARALMAPKVHHK